jgi:hypothetical protein
MLDQGAQSGDVVHQGQDSDGDSPCLTAWQGLHVQRAVIPAGHEVRRHDGEREYSTQDATERPRAASLSCKHVVVHLPHAHAQLYRQNYIQAQRQ